MDLVNMVPTVQPTSTNEQSLFVVHDASDLRFPVVSLQMPTTMAKYIAALIKLDQAKDALVKEKA